MKYKNKYRIESARLKNWDYSSNGYYFITICTKNRENIFGIVKDGNMVLSQIGEIVETEWVRSFEIRRELVCDEYCIMPDHIHGIVIINNPDPVIPVTGPDIPVETHGRASLQTTDTYPTKIETYPTKTDAFPTKTDAFPRRENNTSIQPFRMPESLSSFVSGFKSSATKRINEFRKTPRLPVWQSRFYDHIIRNENDLNRIRQYILDNPQNWNDDN